MSVFPLRAQRLSAAVAAALLLPFTTAFQTAEAAQTPPEPQGPGAAQSAPQKTEQGIPLAPAAMIHGANPFAPVSITFTPDVKACEARFGRDAVSRCRFSFARAGTPEKAVKLAPAHPGQWRWTGPMTLTFTPTEPWPAGKAFKADFSGLAAPVGSRVTAKSAGFSTPPLSATYTSLTLWMDPKAEGERVLTMDAGFTAKPDRAAFEKAFRVETEGASASKTTTTKTAPRFGKPVFLWAENGLSVYVRIPVAALGADPVVVTVTAPGIAGRVTMDPKTGKWSVPKGFADMKASTPIPGTATLMSAELIGTEPVQNEKLESRHEITVRTSLRVTPEALRKALEVRELPLKLDPDAPRTTDWTGAARIDEAVWAKSSPVAFETIGTPGAAAVEHRIRIAGEAGRFVAVRLPKGFGAAPYGLAEDFCRATLLPETRPDVRLLNVGALITREGAGALSIAMSGIDALDWKLSRIEDDFTILALEGYEALRNPRGMEERSTPMKSGRIRLQKSPDAAFASLNLREAVEAKGPGLYTLELTGMVKNDEAAVKAGGPEYVPVTMETRRILMSDLAVLAKKNADETMTVFVSDLVKEVPVDAARVKLLGANGKPVADVLTDKTGRADLPTIRGLEREKRPVAIMVERASGDVAWLSVTDPSTLERWQTEALRFGGRQTASEERELGLALSAAAQTDRGVYRPGETIRWSAVVRDADGRKVPAELPLKLRVTSFEGETLLDEPVTPGNGLVVRDVKIPEGISGRVRLELVSGRWNVLASNVAAVEAFEPETMRLTAPASPAGWKVVDADVLSLPLEARHAAGSAAEGLTLSGHAQIMPLTAGPMPGNADFAVAPPTGARAASRYEALAPVETDKAGRGAVALDAALLPEGFSRVRFDVEGVDAEGGRTVTLSQTMLVGREGLMAGWRLKDHPGKLSFLSQDDPAQIEFLVVDQDLKPVAGKMLTLRTARAERVTELTEGPNGRLTYVETPVRAEASTATLTTGADGRALWTLPTGTPGEGILELVDEKGRVLLETDWRVAGNDLRTLKSPDLPAADMRLSVKSTTLTSGGQAELALVSPFEGYGLVTLEDRQVRHAAWVKVKPGENALSVDLPKEGLTPGRAYLHVSLVRAGALPADAEVRRNAGIRASDDEVERRRANAARLTGGYAEAIVPVTVDADQRRIDLKVEPQTQDGKLRVKITSERPADAVLYAVDEGILSLTHHPAPDVLNAVYLDRALEVVTMEALSLLMPEGLTLPKAPVWGGDVERLASGAAATNPFARTPDSAAVWTSGLVKLNPEGSTFDVKLPEGWHGAVRIVAVAADADGPAVGSTAARAVVSSPLMLEPLTPQAVAPGDSFRAGASVQLEKAPAAGQSVAAKVTIADGSGSDEPLALTIGKSGAGSVGRMMTAPAAPGVMTLDLRAEVTLDGKPQDAKRTTEISVRPPVLPRRMTAVGTVPQTAQADTLPALEPLWAAPGVETRASVSTLPVPWLTALVPNTDVNGCFGVIDPERAAADALGYVALMNVPAVRPSLGGKPQDELAQRHRRIANVRGDLGLDATILAVYLTLPPEADPKPDDIRRVAARVERQITMDPQNAEEARTELLALWLLTREGTLVADRLAALTARMDERLPGWRDGPDALLAGAAYARMRMTPEALKLLGTAMKPGKVTALTLRDAAWARAALADGSTLTGERYPAEDLLPKHFMALLEDGAKRGTSASAAAWSAWALALTNQSTTAEKTLPDSVNLVCRRFAEGFDGTTDLKRTGGAVTLSAPGCVEFAVENVERTGLSEPLYFSLVSVGAPKTLPAAPVSEGLSVTKRYLNAEGKEASTFRTGERVTVEIRIVGTGELVLADPIPGGFMHADRPGAAPEIEDASTRGFLRADDRFVVRLTPYGTAEDGVTTLRYTLRAVTPGTFAAGPAALEDAADGAKRAQGVMSTLKVE